MKTIGLLLSIQMINAAAIIPSQTFTKAKYADVNGNLTVK